MEIENSIPCIFRRVKPLQWLTDMEAYFLRKDLSTDSIKIFVAVLYVDSGTSEWIKQWYGCYTKIEDWEEFKYTLVYNFGDYMENCLLLGYDEEYINSGKPIRGQTLRLEENLIYEEESDQEKELNEVKPIEIQEDDLKFHKDDVSEEHVLGQGSVDKSQEENDASDTIQVKEQVSTEESIQREGISSEAEFDGDTIGTEKFSQVLISDSEPCLIAYEKSVVVNDNCWEDLSRFQYGLSMKLISDHQMFDVFLTNTEDFKHQKKILVPKSWKFKFKEGASKEIDFCGEQTHYSFEMTNKRSNSEKHKQINELGNELTFRMNLLLCYGTEPRPPDLHVGDVVGSKTRDQKEVEQDGRQKRNYDVKVDVICSAICFDIGGFASMEVITWVVEFWSQMTNDVSHFQIELIIRYGSLPRPPEQVCSIGYITERSAYITLDGGSRASAKLKLSTGTKVYIDELEDCTYPTHDMTLLLPKSWKFKFRSKSAVQLQIKETDFIGSFTECKDWFKEHEEEQLSSQLILEMNIFDIGDIEDSGLHLVQNIDSAGVIDIRWNCYGDGDGIMALAQADIDGCLRVDKVDIEVQGYPLKEACGETISSSKCHCLGLDLDLSSTLYNKMQKDWKFKFKKRSLEGEEDVGRNDSSEYNKECDSLNPRKQNGSLYFEALIFMEGLCEAKFKWALLFQFGSLPRPPETNETWIIQKDVDGSAKKRLQDQNSNQFHMNLGDKVLLRREM